MLETQREKVPRNDDGELDTALAFLDFVRSCVLKKVEGLDDEQLRKRWVASDTTLLGLVQHMADGERYWFRHVLAGEDGFGDVDFSMVVDPARPAAEVIEDFRNAVAESNARIRAVGDPAALTARPVDDKPLTLRWLLAHTTGEAARHAGHADILRELTDGVTGR